MVLLLLVSLGGDHFIAYPILKALTKKIGGPVALVQFDASLREPACGLRDRRKTDPGA